MADRTEPSAAARALVEAWCEENGLASNIRSTPDERRSALARRIDALVAEARREEREGCAQVADAHIGAALRTRRASGKRLADCYQPDLIRAEENGENIAAQIIAQAIRARGRDGA